MESKLAIREEKPKHQEIEISCQRCGHMWIYKGTNRWVCTCPHCRTSVMVRSGNKI